MLPDVESDYFYLVSFLGEMGRGIQIGMGGFVPLPHHEIRAWSLNMQMQLTPSEIAAIRDLSIAHCSVANNPGCVCPIDDGAAAEAVEQVNVASWKAITKTGK